MTATENAEQAGFDISLIDDALLCTNEQRALRHQAALNLVLNLALALEQAGQALRDRTQSADEMF